MHTAFFGLPKKLASNSSAGGGSPTSFFNSNYLFLSFFIFIAQTFEAQNIYINQKQVIRVKKTRGAAAPRTRITCELFGEPKNAVCI